MFVDIVKFVCSSAKLVHNMRRLQFYMVLQWIISGRLDASGSRSETPGKFCNVVLEETGKDQLD
jgi:hypothetical protein